MSVGTAIQARDELREALSDEVAFERWYGRVMPRVYAYLAARTRDVQLAEELTQQTFVAAIEARRSFDGRSDSVTWLCAIARHKLADHFRRLDRDEHRVGRAVVREIELGAGPDRWSSVDEREVIARALDALPATQRAAVIFIDWDGSTVREAARLLGKSHGATQSLLARGRATFRDIYEREARDA